MKLKRGFAIVAVLLLFLIGCGQSARTAKDPNLDLWAQENIFPLLTDPRVEWDGKIIIKDLGTLVASSQPKVYYDLFGKPNRAVISDVTLDDSFDFELKRLAVKKEVFATYVFLSWWLDNYDYVHVFDSEFVTLMDGMGYNVLAADLNGYYSYLVSWDGAKAPTCEQLRVVDRLYQEQLVAGDGIERMLKQRCQGSS